MFFGVVVVVVNEKAFCVPTKTSNEKSVTCGDDKTFMLLVEFSFKAYCFEKKSGGSRLSYSLWYVLVDDEN